MLILTLKRHGESLLVKDVEIFDARTIGFRYPKDLDTWFNSPTGGHFRIEGDLQLELCEAGPSDPVAVYAGTEVIGGPSAVTLKGPLGEVRVAYGLKPYIFVAARAAGR